MMEGPAALIEQEWPGLPTPIDAAVVYDGIYTLQFYLYIHKRCCVACEQNAFNKL